MEDVKSNEIKPPWTTGQQQMNLDDVLTRIGQFGPYQKKVVILVSFVAFSTAFNGLGYVFWAARLDHYCIHAHHYSLLPSNATTEDVELLLNRSVPYEENSNGERVRSSCHQYEWDNFSETFKNGIENNSTSIEDCQKWEYDTSVFKSTIVSEMNLVCSRKWLISVTQSAYMAGRFFGSSIFGHASDRFGRRPSLMAAIVIQLVFNFVSCWVNNIYLFIVIRFLIGLETSGEFTIAFVIATENVGPSYRTLTGVIIHLFWAAGYVVVSLIAYFVRERFWFQMALFLPLTLLLTLYWFLPETPRYLLGSGKRKKCLKELNKMAEKNKVIFPNDIESSLQADEKIFNCTFLDLCKYKNIRRTTFILIGTWFSANFVYSGLVLNVTSFSGDMFLNFFLSGIVEIPSYLMVLPLFSKFGRRLPISGCFMISGIALTAVVLAPQNSLVFKTVLAVLGKAAITGAYAMVYIVTAELYPTRMRSIGVGTCSMASRLAGTLSPFTVDLIAIWEYLPFFLFCTTAFIVTFLVLLLPETKDKPLPQTVEEGEQFNGSHRICWGKADSSTTPQPEPLLMKQATTQENSLQSAEDAPRS